VFLSGQSLAVRHHLLQIIGKLLAFANHPQADALPVQIIYFRAHHMAHQIHKQSNFCIRSMPVFRAEGEHRQTADTQFRTGLSDGTQALGTGSVSGSTRQVACICPAMITVHDNHDMFRDRVAILQPQRLVRGLVRRGLNLR
jgi:hypothetical protein